MQAILAAVLFGASTPLSKLLLGLKNSSAANASLLLNFEGVATTLIAALVFKEAIGKRTTWAITLITLGSILLAWQPSANWELSLNALGILGACALWGLDNNFTRNISTRNPLLIVAIKGIGAGTFSLVLASLLGKTISAPTQIFFALLLGFVCYGLSISLFILALRNLGAARTSTLFGIAPFAGMIISIAIFNETPQSLFFYALPLMLGGAWLMLKEDHQHAHIHEHLVHEHCHSHPDEHLVHVHIQGEHFTGEHSHVHIHDDLEHAHPHAPDLHHRHQHETAH